MRRSIFSALLAVALLPFALGAQESESETETGELVAYAYNLQHRGASEALAVVLPLLSSRGAVELQPGGNALVVRDTARALEMIRPKLKSFDHAFAPLRLRVQIIRAEPTAAAESSEPDLPEGVLTRLRELLKYESYSLLAGSEFEIADGMAAVHEVGDSYRVDFRLKHLLSNEQASLQGFRLSRGLNGDFEPLIHANLNLDLEKPMILGLAPNEASDTALMLVIETLAVRAAEVAEK